MGRSRKSYLAAAADLASGIYSGYKTAEYMSTQSKKRKANTGSGKSGSNGTAYQLPYQVKNFNRRRRPAPTNYRRGGFVKSRKRVSKLRLSKKGKVARGGIEVVREVGGTVTGTNCVYIGHITRPVEQVLRAMWAAVVKELLTHAGVDVVEWETVIPMNADMYLEVSYQLKGDGALFQSKPFYRTAGSHTFSEIVLAFLSPTGNLPGTTTCPWMVSSNESRDFAFQSIAFVIGGAATNALKPAKLNMNQLMTNWVIKSTLKMQNRTVTTAEDNEVTDVDNVPLNGKSYMGKGTGASYDKKDANFCCYGDSTNGVITPGTSTITSTQEPPEPWHFAKVFKYGKVRFDPGVMKTSSITDTTSYSFDRLMNMIVPWSTNYNYPVRNLGQYRFVALERMIHNESSTTLAVAFEHNLNMICKAKFKRQTYTCSLVEVGITI